MELPGAGLVKGGWDLRETIDAYLGPVDFQGKTVLDVGTASGYLTFEMEKRGATVTSFDIRNPDDWNYVPYVHPGANPRKSAEIRRGNIEKIRNGYWFAHKSLGSKARMFYGDVYHIPKEIGQFDIVMLGMILPHLRDPFQAMFTASLRAKETLIITQQASRDRDSTAYFMPDPQTRLPVAAWWSMSEGCIKRCVEILGFELVSRKRCKHLCTPQSLRKEKAGPEICTTFVAERRCGAEMFDE